MATGIGVVGAAAAAGTALDRTDDAVWAVARDEVVAGDMVVLDACV
jgi:hypothetical protein